MTELLADDLRALTLRQPWAWLIVEGEKDIENRPWNANLRGAFLIHAAARMTPADYRAAEEMAAAVDPSIRLPEPEELVFGAIVGGASIFDVLEPAAVVRGWRMPGQYGFVLDRAWACAEPVPCRGFQRWWRPAPEILAAVRV